MKCQVDGLVQERRNSIANAQELRLSCTNPSKCDASSKSDPYDNEKSHTRQIDYLFAVCNFLGKKIYNRILGQIAQVAITENTILVPHLWVNSLQLI